MDIADIVVVGSGAAATTTLIELFTKLIEAPFAGKRLNIIVIEKYSEFWKGIPYGSRSSVNSLTITAISDFVSIGKEKTLFYDWLKVNQYQWASYYRENGGIAAEKWLERNLPLLERSEWDMVYLPRFVFGIYMHTRIHQLLSTLEEKKLAQLNLIQAEVIDVTLKDSLYEVTFEYPDQKLSTVTSKKLVIAVGSAPVRNNRVGNILNNKYVYINDLYEPFLDGNLKTLKNTLSSTGNTEERNVLIIGSNASCIELMYLLNHRPDILSVINKVVTLSQAGRMPYHISTLQLDEYPCVNLDQVKANGTYDIHALIDAAKRDIYIAVQNEVIIPYVDRIIGYTLELVHTLDEGSKKMFFGIYGPQLTRLIRRSGPAYKESSDILIDAKKLELLKGKFINIEPTSQGGSLNYTDSDNQSQTYHIPFKVVINCSGSDELRNSPSRLINNLVQKNICIVNLSEKGFLVNEKFEAAPNLYIMGPLLGGNINKLIHFWHLENVSRLLYLSPYLAEILLSE